VLFNVNPASAYDFYSDHVVPIVADAAKYKLFCFSTHRTQLLSPTTYPTNATKNKIVCIVTEQHGQNRNRRTRQVYVGHGVRRIINYECAKRNIA